MSITTNERVLDEKIHDFLARKTEGKLLSDAIAEHIIPADEPAKTHDGIAYEMLEWQEHHQDTRQPRKLRAKLTLLVHRS